MSVSVAELIVRLNDQASGKASEVAAALGKISKAEKDVAANSAQMQKLTAELDKASAAFKKLGDFREAQKGFAQARTAFRDAQKNVEDLARKVAEADKPTRELANSFRRAQEAVRAASAEFTRQKTAVLSLKSDLQGMGVSLDRVSSAENRLRSSIDTTTAALKRQAAAEREVAAAAAQRRGIAGSIAGAAVGIGGSWYAQLAARKALTSAAEFDIETRRQTAVFGINTKDQTDLLIPQAKKIGQETPFTNVDVIKAQNMAMQGLPGGLTGRLRAEVASGIVENVKNYALIMQTDLAEAAEAVRSFLATTGKDISTKEKALAESEKAVNQIVKMAKLGGMSKEDVPAYLKYGMATATAAGITPEAAMTIGALARISGLRGDEAGVMMRSVASKLVGPDRPGMVAMDAAGINYSSFRKMPDRIDSGRLEAAFQRELGTKFTPEVRARLDAILSNPAILGDQGAFTAAVTGAVDPLFGKTKKGQMAAADKQRIAQTTGRFYKASAGSVDAEGLLDAIMGSDMTIAQLNALFTSKQGGKVSITQRQREEYLRMRGEMKNTADNPNMAKTMAETIMGGLGGALENFKGSVENAALALGQANEGWVKPLLDAGGKLLDGFSNLNQNAQVAATALLGLAAAAGLVSGVSTIQDLIKNRGGQLPGLGDLPGGNKPSTGPAAAAGKLGWLGRLLGGVAGGAVLYEMITNPTPMTGTLQGPAGPQLASLNSQIASLEKSSPNDPRLSMLRAQRVRLSGSQQAADDAVPFIPMPGTAETKGAEAGQAAGNGIAAGLKAAQGRIEAEAQQLYDAVRSKFDNPIDVKIKLNTPSLRGIQSDVGVGQ